MGSLRPIRFGGTIFVSTSQLKKLGGVEQPDLYGLAMQMDDYGSDTEWSYFHSGSGLRKVDGRLLDVLVENGAEALYTPESFEIPDSVDQFVQENRKKLVSPDQLRQQRFQQLATGFRRVLAL